MERTFVMVKPDGVQRGLVGEVVSRLERRGLKIVAMKMMHIPRELASRHYEQHKNKAFFNDLISFITSGPVVAMVVEGKNCVAVTRKLMGATDPADAEAGTIRGSLAMDISYNVVHGSDSIESAEREISLFFEPQEICAYERTMDKWIYR